MQYAREFERIREALAEADEPLTAREILTHLEERGETVESSHRVATVLGRRAEHGEIEIVRESPYRYRLTA